jgi:hypothetical protein
MPRVKRGACAHCDSELPVGDNARLSSQARPNSPGAAANRVLPLWRRPVTPFSRMGCPLLLRPGRGFAWGAPGRLRPRPGTPRW